MNFATVEPAAIARLRMRAQHIWGAPPGDAAAALRSLVAVQAQEHAYACWSLGQRAGRATASSVDADLDAGRILRTHVLRPTWHFVAREDLRWLIRLSGPRVQALNASRYRDLGLDARTLGKAVDVIAAAVADGPLVRRELALALERKRLEPDGQRLAYMVMHAELTGVVCSGPRRGAHHTYAAFDHRVPPDPGPDGDDALARLARRYFVTRGPATVRDFAWWSGMPVSVARRAAELAGDALERVETGGRTYRFGARAGRPPTPRADLVQCYDEIVISYSESRDVLASAEAGLAAPRLIDGYAHLVLLDGRVLGHWRAVRGRSTTVLETKLARRLGATELAAVKVAIERYARFLGKPLELLVRAL